MEYFVYILACADGTLYTGITNDMESRLAAHNRGKGAKYTSGRAPVALVYAEGMESKSAALQRELAIKKLTRAGKLRLIASMGCERCGDASALPIPVRHKILAEE